MGTISNEEANELDASVFSYTYGDEALGYKLTLMVYFILISYVLTPEEVWSHRFNLLWSWCL